MSHGSIDNKTISPRRFARSSKNQVFSFFSWSRTVLTVQKGLNYYNRRAAELFNYLHGHNVNDMNLLLIQQSCLSSEPFEPVTPHTNHNSCGLTLTIAFPLFTPMHACTSHEWDIDLCMYVCIYLSLIHYDSGYGHYIKPPQSSN